MTQLSLLRPIDEFNLLAQEMPVVSGRAVHVQKGRYLTHQRRIRVIDDFDTGYQTTVDEVICTNGCAEAVSCALQVRYGAEKVVERGEFAQQKTGLRYPLPVLGHALRYPNLLSADSIAEQREKDTQAQSRTRQLRSQIQQAAGQLLHADNGSRLVMQMYPSDRSSDEYRQAMGIIRGEEKLSPGKPYSAKIRTLGAIRTLADNKAAGLHEDPLMVVMDGIKALQDEAIEYLNPNNPGTAKAYAVIYASQLITEGLVKIALQPGLEPANQIHETYDFERA